MAGDDLVTLAERLQGICLGAGLTVATAESCTGGLVAGALTEVPGASGYFSGSIVAYADAVKRSVLGVPAEFIDGHGSVSVQVARAMAEGARDRLSVDLAVAVTGVAGPGGGTDSKPVGLTYVAVAGPTGVDVRRFHWTDDRASNRRASAMAALEMLIVAAEAASASPEPTAPEPATTDAGATDRPPDRG